MTAERSLRWANANDDTILGEVMFDAVRNGESRFTERQRAAWVPAPRRGPEWASRLAAQEIVLAEEGADVLGFMSLASGGYIDFAYVRPKAQGTGLFRALFAWIEERARFQGESRLWAHASPMAEPALRAVGFEVTAREVVDVNGERFERAEMQRAI